MKAKVSSRQFDYAENRINQIIVEKRDKEIKEVVGLNSARFDEIRSNGNGYTNRELYDMIIDGTAKIKPFEEIVKPVMRCHSSHIGVFFSAYDFPVNPNKDKVEKEMQDSAAKITAILEKYRKLFEESKDKLYLSNIEDILKIISDLQK